MVSQEVSATIGFPNIVSTKARLNLFPSIQAADRKFYADVLPGAGGYIPDAELRAAAGAGPGPLPEHRQRSPTAHVRAAADRRLQPGRAHARPVLRAAGGQLRQLSAGLHRSAAHLRLGPRGAGRLRRTGQSVSDSLLTLPLLFSGSVPRSFLCRP